MSDGDSSLKSGWAQLKELLTLKLDYTKYTIAEKLTLLLAYVAIGLVGVLMGVAVIAFLSVALAQWMSLSIGMMWSCVIVAAIYVVLLLAILAFRKQLIINPISRFITKLMF